MSCAACAARVEKAVSRVEGVDSVTVSLLTNSMTVEGTADDKTVVTAVKQAGYGAKALKENERAENGADPEFKTLRRRFFVSLAVLLPLMYVSMGHMAFGWPLPGFLSTHIAMGLFEAFFQRLPGVGCLRRCRLINFSPDSMLPIFPF